MAFDPTTVCDLEKETDPSKIQAAYADLQQKEKQCEKELRSLVQQHGALAKSMSDLQLLMPNLTKVLSTANNLDGMMSHANSLAENVSAKVRKLDIAKTHVVECLQRVEDILDLKFCTDGVQSAMSSEDYEQAAGHVHRFLSMDENVLRLSALATEGTTIESSFATLREAEAKLRKIVHQKFDAAVHSGDLASVTRFCKIFPLLGLHDEGLLKYSKYLCSQISEKVTGELKIASKFANDEKSGRTAYADLFTFLFEEIARTVESHQPLVETCYGPGRIFTFISYLQDECDRQASKIMESFRTARRIDVMTKRIQNTLMASRQPTEKLDPRELDPLLTEMALVSTRTELYLRFVKRRIAADIEISTTEGTEARETATNKMINLLNNCKLSHMVQDIISSYLSLEEYFMKEMVFKAIRLDMIDDESLTSSMVDDAFFIIKKCVRRSLSTSSIDCVCAMLNHVSSILEQEFISALQSSFQGGFPSGFDLTHAYSIVQNTFQQGKPQASEVDRARKAYLVALNNAEASCTCIKTLKASLEEEISKVYAQQFKSEADSAKVENCLSNLQTAHGEFKNLLSNSLQELQNSFIKPRVKTQIDTFLSVKHILTEEDYINFEANDPWAQAFVVDIDQLLLGFKNFLSANNFDTLVSQVANEITLQLESASLRCSYNRLGGLQFDKELRQIVGFLTSSTTWTIRDKFARLTQIATILNLEAVAEFSEYWGSSTSVTWRLTPAEVRQTLSLRIDFLAEEIRALKL